MAEAPTILLLLSLTFPTNPSVLAALFQTLFITTFLLWVTHACRSFSTKANKMDASRRRSLRTSRRNVRNKHVYHFFRQRMKRKRANKGKHTKPPKLFHLTWKFKTICLTLRAITFAAMAGCRVKRLVGSFFQQMLLCVCHLRHRLCIQCRLQRHSATVAFHSTIDKLSNMPFRPRFDTDSFKIGIDTLCSVTMSGSKDCFKDLRLSEGATISGIAGGLVSQGQGTFCFQLDDDDGVRHSIHLPNNLYVPGLPKTLLCPQQWAQHDHDDGTYIKNTATGCWLVWNRGRSKKFVPLNESINTPTFTTASGTFHYRAFEATIMACDASTPQLRQHLSYDDILLRRLHHHPESFIADEDINLQKKDDEDEVSADDDTVQISNVHHLDVAPDEPCPLHPTGHHKWGDCSQHPDNHSIHRRTLTFSPVPRQTEADQLNDAESASDDQLELLRWHHRLGHLPFTQLKLLAKNGEIPKRFEKVKEPRCAGCLFGKMTKVPWRTRSKTNNKVHEATYPGQCVSVDQMESTQAGFIAQLKGRLTTKRYKAATVFVDHFSRL
jgi:hypothetical protein